MSNPLPITADDFDDLIEEAFPAGFIRKVPGKMIAVGDVILAYGPLDSTHLAALQAHLDSGKSLGVNITGSQQVKALRASHHRIAQLLAGGMEQVKVAALTNRSLGYLQQLKSDPAFVELLAHYTSEGDAEFADFITAASELRQDMLGALAEMLETAPEKFGPGHLMDAIKLLADRTGHAPVTKTHNVNVNLNLGDRLRAARERANTREILDITPRTGTA